MPGQDSGGMVLMTKAQVCQPEGLRAGELAQPHRLAHLGVWVWHFGEHGEAGSGGMGLSELAPTARELSLPPTDGSIGWPSKSSAGEVALVL